MADWQELKPYRAMQLVLAAGLLLLGACGGEAGEAETTTESAAATQAPRQPVSRPATPQQRAAGPLQFTLPDGRTGSLEDYRGQPVMAFIFSTTCPHCQQASQQLAPVYADLHPRGVEFLGLAMDRGAETRLSQFAQNYNAQFPLTTITPAAFSAFTGISLSQSLSFPVLVFVDSEGNISEWHQGRETGFFANLAPNVRSILEGLLARAE